MYFKKFTGNYYYNSYVRQFLYFRQFCALYKQTSLNRAQPRMLTGCHCDFPLDSSVKRQSCDFPPEPISSLVRGRIWSRSRSRALYQQAFKMQSFISLKFPYRRNSYVYTNTREPTLLSQGKRCSL